MMNYYQDQKEQYACMINGQQATKEEYQRFIETKTKNRRYERAN